MKTSQTRRMDVVDFNLPHSLRDTSKPSPRKIMTRSFKYEVSLRRAKGEEKSNELPQLPLLGGKSRKGQSTPLARTTLSAHIMKTRMSL